MTVIIADGRLEVRPHPSRCMLDIAVPQPAGELCLRLSKEEARELLFELASAFGRGLAP